LVKHSDLCPMFNTNGKTVLCQELISFLYKSTN